MLQGARQILQLTPQQFLLVFIILAAPFSLYYFGPPIITNFHPKPILLSAVLQFQDTRSVHVEKMSAVTKTLNVTGKSALCDKFKLYNSINQGCHNSQLYLSDWLTLKHPILPYK